MKTNISALFLTARPNHRFPLLNAAGVFLLLIGTVFPLTVPATDFVAHEWGTFTSVQGGDGQLLRWKPLESSRLPGFVYNWQKPGLNRTLGLAVALSKVGLVTLQRMETPVIYFYSEKEITADVSVGFPHGYITEWYPQAEQIGPVMNLAGQGGKYALNESRATWKNVHILPRTKANKSSEMLPSDSSGSHYFAARNTDASYLKVASLNITNQVADQEKFIFYRGAGNFTTPLEVTMSGESLTVENTGTQPISHLFLLKLDGNGGTEIAVHGLAAGQKRTVEALKTLSRAQLQTRLGDQMAKALVAEGLFAREAAAMVETWKDSWFAEDGMRVLYVLPRAWTDQVLPLDIKPAPSDLVRVMVGRAEVISPSVQKRLSQAVARAEAGDAEAGKVVVAELKKLGRFAEPALNLATRNATPKIVQAGRTLYQASLKGAG